MPRRALDLRRQRALSRYYVDAGASGLAVGVHTTQFAIREAGLYEPVLATRGRGRERGRAAAGHDRGPGRPDRAGPARGRHRARPRLPCRPAQPRGAEGRVRGRADRALRARRRRNPAGGLLSATGGRRRGAAGRLLAPLRRDRQRRRDQDRAVQPLPHAGRDPRRGRGGRRAPHHALDRQRRPHRRSTCSRRSPSAAATRR